MQAQGVRHTVTASSESEQRNVGMLIGPGSEFAPDRSLGWSSAGQAYLSSMEPEPSALVPSLPLVLYDGLGEHRLPGDRALRWRCGCSSKSCWPCRSTSEAGERA